MKHGWEYKQIGDVCEVINGLWTGKKPPFVNVGVIRNTNFTKECTLAPSNIFYTDVEVKAYAKRKLQHGDIIIEKSGGSDKQPVGRPILFNLDGEFSFSNFTSVLRIKDVSIIADYLHRALTGIYLQGKTRALQSKTTGIHNLDFNKYLRLAIPVPSLSVQQQIVSLLDKLSFVIEKKKQQVKELDNLAQAIFYDMFGDPVENEKGWEVKQLSKVCSLKAGKAIKAAELLKQPSSSNYPCYGGNGIRGYINKLSHNKTLPIIGRQGALCGNVNLAIAPFYATEHAVVVTPIIDIDVIWLYYQLSLMKLNQYAHGVAQPGLAVQDIEPLYISLPPLPLQQTFAEKIESIERQKELINQSIREAQTLFDSRMEYYFGE